MSPLLFCMEAVRCSRTERRNHATRFLSRGFRQSPTTTKRIQACVAKPEMNGHIHSTADTKTSAKRGAGCVFSGLVCVDCRARVVVSPVEPIVLYYIDPLKADAFCLA